MQTRRVAAAGAIAQAAGGSQDDVVDRAESQQAFAEQAALKPHLWGRWGPSAAAAGFAVPDEPDVNVVTFHSEDSRQRDELARE